MAKRLKLRICRVITTTLQSCRSRDPSNLPENPVPSLSRLSPVNPKSSVAAAIQNHRSSLVSTATQPSSHASEFKWQKEEKWHVVAKIHEPHRKIHNSSASDDDGLPNPASSEKKKRLVKNKKNKKKKNVPSRLRVSTSSADSGWFSSDGGGASAAAERDEEETETLVSSSISCLSTDSSSEISKLQPIKESQPFTTNLPHRKSTHKRRANNSKRTKRGGAVRHPTLPIPIPPPHTAEAEIPARLSVFQKLIPCTVEGKVKESFAIVKRSSDPYEDFKNSMMDMIVEKQMFEKKDLEQLLQCFLSLNSRHYHGIIVEAFSEIWDVVFSSPAAAAASKSSSDHHRPLVHQK